MSAKRSMSPITWRCRTGHPSSLRTRSPIASRTAVLPTPRLPIRPEPNLGWRGPARKAAMVSASTSSRPARTGGLIPKLGVYGGSLGTIRNPCRLWGVADVSAGHAELGSIRNQEVRPRSCPQFVRERRVTDSPGPLGGLLAASLDYLLDVRPSHGRGLRPAT